MRLAIINDEVHQDLATAIETVTTQGFAGLEIRSVWNVPPHDLTDEHLRDIRRALTDSGLAAAGFCPPALKCALPRAAGEIADVRAVLTRAIDQARLLAAPHVRIFSFYRDGDPDPVVAASAAQEVLDGIEPEGVGLLLETGTRTNTPTMELTLRFLEALGRADIGILWDPGNSVFSGWHERPFPAEYRMGRDMIRHVHVKDPDGTARYVRLGDGDLPWREIVEALRADGYPGWLSLETHWRRGRVLTRRQRDTPWGDAFSEGGQAASVECMGRLRELVTG